jgi:carbon storage regulator CsrA
MLVITRKVGESFIIGDGEVTVTVTVLESTRGAVSLGIDAPTDITISRSELLTENEQDGGRE